MLTLFQTPARKLAHWRTRLAAIDVAGEAFAKLDREAMRKQSLSLRYRLKSGEPLDAVLPEAFALVREAATRTVKMRHYPMQLIGGMALVDRCLAEMQTGEGKTLTATLPLYLAALAGKGAHLATANDYLARRDADLMRSVYEALGLTVGVVEADTPRAQRAAAYQCDVTYSTAKEMGFDFLRDRLLLRRLGEGHSDRLGEMLGLAGAAGGDQPVQRPPYFALIDEADSILIDEARTPLIISGLPGDAEAAQVAAYRWAAAMAAAFEDEQHYEYDHDRRAAHLTPLGRRLTRELEKPPELDALAMYDLYEFIERAIKVNRDLIRDRHYVVREGEVVIVDEFTGRLAEGRKWRSGLHQAVEAREDVTVTVDSGQAARITIQDYFLRYPQLGGMTGTATNSAGEMRRIYRLLVVPVPTNRPPIREEYAPRVLANEEAKWKAIVEEVEAIHAAGRPVLIGTRSIDKSERLSHHLREASLPHQVLNARHIAREADIVALAGQRGKITVATNMAGRGTDIRLGPGVEELGGLHVICTELHDSARIDRQLIGRCGRQGDPGSYRQYLAMDDEILRLAFGPDKAERYRALGETANEAQLAARVKLFYKAQKRIERQHFKQRRLLMYAEKQRKLAHWQMGQDPYLDTPG